MQNIEKYYVNFLLISWLRGLLMTRMTNHRIPWMNCEHNSPFGISFSKKKKIIQRGMSVYHLIQKLVCSHNNVNYRSYQYYAFCKVFNRLFTSPENGSVARLFCNPNFCRMHHATIISGNEYLYSFTEIHQTLPIVARVDRRGSYDLTLLYLSYDLKKIEQREIIKVSASNETFAFHSFHPLLAIVTESDRDIVIYRILCNRITPSYLVETLTGHEKTITALSFSKGTSGVIKIASGDRLGNIRVYQMNFNSPNSSQCLGVLRNIQSDFYSKFNPITSIDWSNNNMISTNSNGNIWKIDCQDGMNWAINTPIIKKSPSNLNAVSFIITNTIDIRHISVHPSGKFFATRSGYKKINIWDATTFQSKYTYMSPFYVFSMRFNVDGSILFIGGPKEIIALKIQQNGDDMSLLSRYSVGHTRYVSSIAMHQTDERNVVIAGDLTGLCVVIKL